MGTALRRVSLECMETGALVKFRTGIRTEGMTCGSCAAWVQTALGTTDGVINATAAMGRHRCSW